MNCTMSKFNIVDNQIDSKSQIRVINEFSSNNYNQLRKEFDTSADNCYK